MQNPDRFCRLNFVPELIWEYNISSICLQSKEATIEIMTHESRRKTLCVFFCAQKEGGKQRIILSSTHGAILRFMNPVARKKWMYSFVKKPVNCICLASMDCSAGPEGGNLMQIGVEWENVNMLDIETIIAMAEDGYAFAIGDGRIQCVVLTIGMFQ